MGLGFYSKFAIDGMKKNKRLYVPYLLTFIGMVMMFYIIDSMIYNETISSIRGHTTLFIILGMGRYVIAIFAAIFLFYTNSFLTKRRKKEFGLYSILGMSRKNISKIICWESFITATLSLFLGLVLGIAFSKLSELGLLKLMGQTGDFSFNISLMGIMETLVVFCAISVLLLANGLRQIRFQSTMDLLKSMNTGEKPPKGNWFLGLGGLILLAVAYYIAISIKEPIAAMSYFFLAVVLVIIGTYMLMISGSVLLCKILQKNKKYYYKTNHFISVSSMAYRMKRNGAGLATICILATMVLVMISSTSSLYIGAEDSLNTQYPRDYVLEALPDDMDTMDDEHLNTFMELVTSWLDKRGIEQYDSYGFREAAMIGELEDGKVSLSPESITNLDKLCYYTLVPLSDYNKVMGTNETLKDNEALMLCTRAEYEGDTIQFEDSKPIKIKKEIDSFVPLSGDNSPISGNVLLVVNNYEEILRPLATLENVESNATRLAIHYYCDIDEMDESALEAVSGDITDGMYKEMGVSGSYTAIKSLVSDDFYGTYGGLFYLGIILSLVFMVAAALIIYYKQISEGYEDQSRFDIMQKVGITKKEIKRTINSQLLTVFFFPLILAGVHMAFAFPMITKMLQIFYLYNVNLFLMATLISFVVFAIGYGIVYKRTSKSYYKIVSDAKN